MISYGQQSDGRGNRLSPRNDDRSESLQGRIRWSAIRYQIVVMFMLGSAVALAAVVVVLGYRKTFFTPAEQLRPEDA